METVLFVLSCVSAFMWVGVLLAPWRPWSTREFLDWPDGGAQEDLGDITALIPARNEAGHIETTLRSLNLQGDSLNIIVIDDQSTDDTAARAAAAGCTNLRIISGSALPKGWSGKLWALEQGRRHIATPLALLIDADIELRPGILSALMRLMQERNLHMASLMAQLRMQGFWEKLLMPAFIYFFKLLYPFRLANSGTSKIAAAAGGCILLETRWLDEIGGFQALQGELIDDCALARRVKQAGGSTWIGLTHGALSQRVYDSLGSIWNMVARTAFTQLKYSIWLLLACMLLLMLAFWAPLAGAAWGAPAAKLMSLAAIACMMAGYLPTLRFYRMPLLWAAGMPLIGTLYLCMTVTSAVRYWQGRRSEWKGRVYSRK